MCAVFGKIKNVYNFPVQFHLILLSGKDADPVCCLGKGVVIPFMDRGTIYNKDLCALLQRIAEENDIPWQSKTRIAGGTDGSAIQRSGSGVAVAAVSVPVRNIHSPSSVATVQECEDQYKLARLFLEEMAK